MSGAGAAAALPRIIPLGWMAATEVSFVCRFYAQIKTRFGFARYITAICTFTLPEKLKVGDPSYRELSI
jgi:hypothetical protein